MTEWKKGKVKRYTAGATAVLFEGQKEGEKEIWVPVIEKIQKIVRCFIIAISCCSI